jgi:5,10-methylenetetrahydromethanopterin reductase
VMHGKTNGPVSVKDRAVLETLRSNYDMKAHTRGDSRQAASLTDDFIDRFAIVGPPDRCIERLKSLAKLGLDKVAISGRTRGVSVEDAAVGLDLLTKHVLPVMTA